MYKPDPINTENIVLPGELTALTEIIAENVHQVWAQRRIEEGWSFAEQTDAANKKTCCLVPYDELPENEKEYDRRTALETLKLIVKFGYTITKI